MVEWMPWPVLSTVTVVKLKLARSKETRRRGAWWWAWEEADGDEGGAQLERRYSDIQ